jgi:serine/threonine-protein kinase PpkA
LSDLKIDGYKILGPLGQGGMATVYLAVQENFDREVALKVMSHKLLADPSFGDRFLREAKIVAQLSHQHIVPVYDVGAQDDNHYIAMEKLPNGDLEDKLKEGLPLTDCFVVIKQMAMALDYAVSKGYIHRDIKPENILFREDGSAVLSDFGIARSTTTDSQMTQAGTVVGTPHYMAPEQAQGLELDGRADLYALGVIFYEMLSGHVPFDAESAVSIGIKHITEPVPTLDPDLAEFQDFVDTVLAKDPDDRYQTGAELIAALNDLENNLKGGTQVISAEHAKKLAAAVKAGKKPGQTSVRRGTKSAPKQQSSSKTPAIVIAVILVGLLGAGGWFYFEQQQAEKIELAKQQKIEAESTKKRQLLESEVSKLLAAAKQDVDEGRLAQPSGNNAVEKFQQVLAMTPDNVSAIRGLVSAGDKLILMADKAIAAKDPKAAQKHLKAAQVLAPNNISLDVTRRAFTSLLDELAADKKSAQLAQAQQQAEARRMAEQKRLAAQRASAPKQTVAPRPTVGKNSAVYAREVASLIRQREYDKADAELKKLKKTDPNYVEIPLLENQLFSGLDRLDQSNSVLDEAQSLVDTEYKKPGVFGSNRSTLGALKATYTMIQAARGIDPGNPRVSKQLLSLEDKYILVVEMHSNNKDYGDAEEFLKDAIKMRFPDDRIEKLQDKVKAMKFKSTRPTGIF